MKIYIIFNIHNLGTKSEKRKPIEIWAYCRCADREEYVKQSLRPKNNTKCLGVVEPALTTDFCSNEDKLHKFGVPFKLKTLKDKDYDDYYYGEEEEEYYQGGNQNQVCITTILVFKT